MNIFEKIWKKENKEESRGEEKSNELIIDSDTELVETKELKEMEDKFDKKGRDSEAWREQP